MNMTQILIDFDIHKLIEKNRNSFDDTPNDVLRRLLNLSAAPKEEKEARPQQGGFPAGGIFIPAGLTLRKILKGVTHEAQTVDGGIRYKGKTFDSPSAAACAAAENSVNGWIFWDYLDKTTGEWRPLDSLRKRR